MARLDDLGEPSRVRGRERCTEQPAGWNQLVVAFVGGALLEQFDDLLRHIHRATLPRAPRVITSAAQRFMAGRLAAMLDYARASDTVVVTAIYRLGRSVAEVTRTIADLGERRILLRALREGIDTATPTGRAVAGIMATLAELELELGRERRAASRQSRRVRGLPASKPPKRSRQRQEQLRRLAAAGEPVRALAEAFRYRGGRRIAMSPKENPQQAHC